MFRENYPVNNPSDYWKISLYLVILDLVEVISKGVLSNEERVLFYILSKPCKSSNTNT